MDVDIDLQTDFDPLEYFDQAIRASMVKDGELKKHPAGAYLQFMPPDRVTNLAAIPYDKAEGLGYVKFDFLHLSLLDYFDNKEQIRALVNKEPDWNLLLSAENVQKLFQIHRHYKIISTIKPRSVQELADTIALIRPAKRDLLDQYLHDKEQTRKQLYTKPSDGKYYFKRSHAVAYALTIVLQLHLIKGGIL